LWIGNLRCALAFFYKRVNRSAAESRQALRRLQAQTKRRRPGRRFLQADDAGEKEMGFGKWGFDLFLIIWGAFLSSCSFLIKRGKARRRTPRFRSSSASRCCFVGVSNPWAGSSMRLVADFQRVLAEAPAFAVILFCLVPSRCLLVVCGRGPRGSAHFDPDYHGCRIEKRRLLANWVGHADRFFWPRERDSFLIIEFAKGGEYEKGKNLWLMRHFEGGQGLRLRPI